MSSDDPLDRLRAERWTRATGGYVGDEIEPVVSRTDGADPNPPCGQPGHQRRIVPDPNSDPPPPPWTNYRMCCEARPDALQPMLPYRWAAFTDDELWHLATALEVSFDGGQVEPGWDDVVEKELTAAIRAEIERRKGEA